MIIDKNGNELRVDDMVRFVAYRHGPYELGIIEIINESTSLYIRCIGPLQHPSVGENIEEILTWLD